MIGWHIADGATKSEKQLRAATTSKYGTYAISFLFAFLVLISLANIILPRLHSLKLVIFQKNSTSYSQETKLQQKLQQQHTKYVGDRSALLNREIPSQYSDNPQAILGIVVRPASPLTHSNSHSHSHPHSNSHSHRHSHSHSHSQNHSQSHLHPHYHLNSSSNPLPLPNSKFPSRPVSPTSSPDLRSGITKPPSPCNPGLINISNHYKNNNRLDPIIDTETPNQKTPDNSGTSGNNYLHPNSYLKLPPPSLPFRSPSCNEPSSPLAKSQSISTEYSSTDFSDDDDDDNKHSTLPTPQSTPPPLQSIPTPTPSLLPSTSSLSFITKYLYSYTNKLPLRAIKLPLRPIVIFWTAVFLVLIFSETHYEFTYLAKRLGRVPTALLPPVYFLTLRPSPLPQTFYLQLVPFHKWLSRLVFLMLMAHAIVYFYIYATMGKLKKLTTLTNISGIIAFFMFVAIVLTSLKPIRRRYYNTIFFPTHYVLTWIVLPLIYYHSAKTNATYVYLCFAVLLMQIGYRFYLSQSRIQLPVQYISSSMLFVALPRDKLPKSFRNHFFPGSHVRVSSSPMLYSRIAQYIPWASPPSRVPKPNGSLASALVQSTHPYTVASLPQDPVLMLCIRKTRFPIRLRHAYTLAGPYESVPCSFFDDVARGHVKRALFVAGGTGIAFCAPLMRHLRAMNVPVKLLWAIRDMNDAKVLTHLGLAQAALEDKQVEIYVTRIKKKHRSFANPSYFNPGINSGTVMSRSGSFSSFMDDDDDISVRHSGGFKSMFWPQTVDERFDVTIDDTWCDGGGAGTNTVFGARKARPGYVDEQGNISKHRASSMSSGLSSSSSSIRYIDVGNNNGPGTSTGPGNGNGDEESLLDNVSSSLANYGSQNNTYRPPGVTPTITIGGVPFPSGLRSVTGVDSDSETESQNQSQGLPISEPVSRPNSAAGIASGGSSLFRGNSSHGSLLQRALRYSNPVTDFDFTPIMTNSRPVLNLRLKSWLYGVAVDGNTCCCADQLLQLDKDYPDKQEKIKARAGRWILASGGEALVGETERWAAENGFSFYKDEFSL